MASHAHEQQGFPVLFFSYAHTHWDDPNEQQDADLWVRKFYGHLCTEIERLVDMPRGHDPLFIDRRIALGANWRRVLAENLARCSVFVPLYSKNYFLHPDCGREWSIIRMRQDMHVAATKSYPNIVVPVLWDAVRPQDMPPWANDIQYAHEELGHAYRTYGLQELLRIKDHEADYHRAVRFLARQIVDVANAPEQLRVLREIPDFRTLPDEFAQRGPGAEPGKVRITVVALDTRAPLPQHRTHRWYGSTGLDWTPYRDMEDGAGHDTPAVWRASDVARQRSYITEVTELSPRSEELRNASHPSAPTILLVDPWATLDTSRWVMLDRLDKITQHKPWIRIIVPWNARDPETIASANVLHGGIEARLGHARSQGRIPSRRGEPGPPDSASFGLAVSEALRIAFAEFVRQSAKYLPPGPYPGKPRLGGPIGMGEAWGYQNTAHQGPDEDGEGP
jgi:FxsC-like protein